ncbi:type 1 glutamine amidotransferase domain-containing protein [Chitinophaga sp. YIM B06452]|uniref:type 1 glutamine amidotransferase domain-containing protein n=1 Tax=Chitinophaga sp. YIM B06452 TaxID=3082158 RepID=UPI0031FEB782
MKTLTKILLAVGFLFVAAITQARQAGIKNENMKHKKVLFILSSVSKVKATGQPTGTWIEEFASPYYYLLEKGIDITIATPEGGIAPIDPKSQLPEYFTPAVKKFNEDKAAREKLNHTQKLSGINPGEYDAVFYPGGHGPTWDLPGNKVSIAIIESFYRAGKPVALVCHGPAALVNAMAANGEPLVKGKKVSGFTNSEEQAGKTTDAVPFPLEDRLKELGALYQKGPDWQPFAVADGKLLTGQNPASAELVAEHLFRLL